MKKAVSSKICAVSRNNLWHIAQILLTPSQLMQHWAKTTWRQTSVSHVYGHQIDFNYFSLLNIWRSLTFWFSLDSSHQIELGEVSWTASQSVPDINQPLLGTTLHNFCSTRNRAGLPLIKWKGRGWQGTGKEKRKRKTRGTWENTAGEDILIEIGWFWVKSGSLWHIWMHSLLLVLINDSCTIVCWQSLPYRHKFFLIWNTAENATQSDLAPEQHVLSSLYCELRLIGNQLWQSGKRALSFSRKEKKKNKKTNCVKTITICSAKQQIKQNTLTVFKYHKLMY